MWSARSAGTLGDGSATSFRVTVAGPQVSLFVEDRGEGNGDFELEGGHGPPYPYDRPFDMQLVPAAAAETDRPRQGVTLPNG